MELQELRERLYSLRDETYHQFQSKLIPNIPADSIIGVRTPELRKLAREMGAEEEFLKAIPHQYFEENQLHSFILGDGKDFQWTLEEVEAFLPYVDNWATCDQLCPKVFKKYRQELLPHICRWQKSDHPYKIRFAMKMLMDHFLDDDFDAEFPALVAAVQSEEYYVRMMQAWYFATALAKQYDAVIPYIMEQRLEKWTHNKAIQKAIESYRISDEQKEFLKIFRRR